MLLTHKLPGFHIPEAAVTTFWSQSCSKTTKLISFIKCNDNSEYYSAYLSRHLNLLIYNPVIFQILTFNLHGSINQRIVLSQIAVVNQDPVLFSTSIRDNIAYGLSDCSLDQIRDAAQKAGAHDFISKLTSGYDTGKLISLYPLD